jgi:hypothetical protein
LKWSCNSENNGVPSGAPSAGFRNTTTSLSAKTFQQCMWFQALTAESMKMMAVLDIAPCCFVGVDRRFRRAYCVHHQGNETSETSVYSSETAWRHIPEDSHYQTRRRENLKSHNRHNL